MNRTSGIYGTTNDPTFVSLESQRERRNRVRLKVYSRKQWLKTSQIWSQVYRFKKLRKFLNQGKFKESHVTGSTVNNNNNNTS